LMPPAHALSHWIGKVQRTFTSLCSVAIMRQRGIAVLGGCEAGTRGCRNARRFRGRCVR
jgi:hypothetical protein